MHYGRLELKKKKAAITKFLQLTIRETIPTLKVSDYAITVTSWHTLISDNQHKMICCF